MLIINYHYCQPETFHLFSTMAGVHPSLFARQIHALVKGFPLKGDEMASREGELFRVTFDDGTKDFLQFALPELVRWRIRPVLFCSTRPLMEGKVLNVQKIHLLRGRLGWDVFRDKMERVLTTLGFDQTYDDPARLGLDSMYRYDTETIRRFKFLLNVELPYVYLDKALDILFTDEFGDQKKAVDDIYLTVEELKRCQDAGCIIGAHTHSHPILSRLSYEEQYREIQTSVEYLRETFGNGVTEDRKSVV
jgi:hypothetical protein